ncbi:hypothetical protein SAMN05444161_1326 [Rhizobiales bacterium GAS191]|nr:hypothetical protein SAMN05444161_1326 [Rhizobiales bacterium GAS191]
MAAYSLVIGLTGAKSPVLTLPPSDTPYASFTVGDTIDFSEQGQGVCLVQSVWNRFSGPPDAIAHETAVVVTPTIVNPGDFSPWSWLSADSTS